MRKGFPNKDATNDRRFVTTRLQRGILRCSRLFGVDPAMIERTLTYKIQYRAKKSSEDEIRPFSGRS